MSQVESLMRRLVNEVVRSKPNHHYLFCHPAAVEDVEREIYRLVNNPRGLTTSEFLAAQGIELVTCTELPDRGRDGQVYAPIFDAYRLATGEGKVGWERMTPGYFSGVVFPHFVRTNPSLGGIRRILMDLDPVTPFDRSSISRRETAPNSDSDPPSR